MKFYAFLMISCLISSLDSTLGPGDRKSKSKTKVETATTTSAPPSAESNQIDTTLSVIDRNLVTNNRITPREILFNYDKYCKPCASDKTFKGKVLGYVTPWNSKGYDVAKMFSKKLDSISPVWLQITRKGRKDYQFTGTHDIDKKWMKSVRKNNEKSQFLPRILFENLKTTDLHALFNDEEELTSLAKMLVEKAKEYNFDGYVLEIYSQLGGHGKTQINHLVTDVANMLHENNKIIILVIPPALKLMTDLEKVDETNAVFSKQDFYNLKDVVDGFSLMTYDYSVNAGQIGPNAPYDWIRDNVKYLSDTPEFRSKIYLGLNFYGMKYELDMSNKPKSQPEPLLGSGLIDLLKKHQAEIIFEDKIQEHLFLFKGGPTQTLVFYPTLYSIKKRIELAEELGTSLSIWELGQGFDYFYDLL